MPQSLACLHVHLIYSTKNRAPILSDALRPELHAYMATVLRNLECFAVTINSVEDHVHILTNVARTISVSEVVGKTKTASTHWIKGRDPKLSGMSWQAGYAAFAVSASDIAEVQSYVERQKEHHQKRTFQEEMRAFFERHVVTYDERYVWD